MAETIESFVQKLQEEGVDAGREQAQKLLDEAGAKAEGIVADAQRRAEEIIADAKAQAETDLRRGRDELALACRDVLLRLRATVMSTLEAVLKSSSQDKLRDEEFFVRLLHDVAVQYAEKDSIGESPVVISVDEDMLEAATRWAMQEMTSNGGDDWRSRIDLKGRPFLVTADEVVNPEGPAQDRRLRVLRGQRHHRGNARVRLGGAQRDDLAAAAGDRPGPPGIGGTVGSPTPWPVGTTSS